MLTLLTAINEKLVAKCRNRVFILSTCNCNKALPVRILDKAFKYLAEYFITNAINSCNLIKNVIFMTDLPARNTCKRELSKILETVFMDCDWSLDLDRNRQNGNTC